jgi:Protein of unknown function (DUF1416)
VTRVLGHVKLGDGSPATGATVEVHNSAGDVVDQVRVDDVGDFTYFLSPGQWRFRVWDAAGHRGEAAISLKQDEDAADLDLAIS